jgi:osmotically-inducible protein OsmY
VYPHFINITISQTTFSQKVSLTNIHFRKEEKMMKKIFAAISTFTLFAALSFGVAAQDPVTKGAQKAGDTTKKAAEKTADTTKDAAQKAKETVAPKSDADIQKCIEDGLAASAKLKDQGFTAAVSNGEATLTGTAKSSGDVKSAGKIANKCKAKKVTNNITVSAPARPAKPDQKSEPAKKP